MVEQSHVGEPIRRRIVTQDSTGREALVSGSGQGIGKGIAARLAADGLRVLIADIDAEAAAGGAGSDAAYWY